MLMLGWNLRNGAIRPDPDRAEAFLRACAARCHSVMITGEELNTQYYATEDGGLALPFFRYWIGVLRTAAPDTFVWARIDETINRGNRRNLRWLESLLPVTDGVAYQVAHSTGAPRNHLSRQFMELRRHWDEIETEARERGEAVPERPPLLVGGFSQPVALPAGFGQATRRAAGRSRTEYETWLRGRGIAGYIRFVGFLPDSPVAELLSMQVAGGQQPAPTQE